MIVEEKLVCRIEPNGGWDSRIQIAQCGDLVRSYLIATERFVLVYDTLLGPKSGGWLRARALEQAQGRPLLVVNSHADWDHYFGNMCFPEPILGSALCASRIKGEPGATELAKKRAEHPADYEQVRLVAPAILVDGPVTLDGGDLTVRILGTIGHRPDHLALWIPELRTLLPGDCVEDPIPLVDESSTEESTTIAELEGSLRGMVALDPEWVLANHAAPQRGTARMEMNLAYLDDLRREAATQKSLEALHSKLPSSSEWGDFYREAHRAQVEMAWHQRRLTGGESASEA